MWKLSKKQKKALARILTSGVVLLVLGGLTFADLLPDVWYLRLPLFLIAYLPVGIEVWRKAFSNLFHGQLLDENFLMTLATVGAFAIGEYPEGVFVMLFYQVGELFQSIAVGKSRRSIATLMDIKPDEARVLRDESEAVVSPDEVAVGEIILVRPGERVPLDGEIVEGKSELDTRSLTGETLPRSVKAGDEVISGCINLSGVLRVRITKPFGESTVSKILELVEHSALVKSKAENAVTKFARWYTPLVVAGAVLLATVPPIFLGDFTRWLRSAFIFLVISCPCALVISVPLSFFSGIGKASRAGILIKGANYLEALSNVDTVVFDKTGTLTSGVFSVTSILPAEGVSEQELLTLAGAAEQHSNHPIARSVLDACSNLTLPSAVGVEEFSGRGVSALVGGKQLLVGNQVLMDSVGLSVSKAGSVGTELFVSFDNRFLGSILISDTLKSDAKETMIALHKNGVRKTVMLTGDRKAVADAVASALDLDSYQSDLLPADKVSAVESLLSTKRGTLVFVGDGVNDAPVLARADVGIAMGAFGSDAAIEAADVVLMDDRPSKIPEAIGIARFTKKIVTENIWFAISVKILFLILSIFNLTNMWAATFADVGVAVIAILNAMR